jgi:hypothetical protein
MVAQAPPSSNAASASALPAASPAPVLSKMHQARAVAGRRASSAARACSQASS